MNQRGGSIYIAHAEWNGAENWSEERSDVNTDEEYPSFSDEEDEKPAEKVSFVELVCYSPTF
jgi:hypothetical protein